MSDSGQINDHFQRDIQVACKKAIEQFRQAHPTADVCGFALYSDADARTLVPSFNTADHLARVQAEEPAEQGYFKWSPAEWSHETFGGEYFNALSSLLWDLADSIPDEDFERHRALVFKHCVAALKPLTTCAFKNAIYVFAVSDFQSVPEEIAWITQLNTPEQALEFKTWLEQVEQ